MGQEKSFGYSAVKKIITSCQDQRTQAILAIDYGFACRIGELSREYHHLYTKGLFNSRGPIIADFTLKKEQQELVFAKPNFKQAKEKDRAGTIVGVKHFASFINYSFEPWLYDIIFNWIKEKEPTESLFKLQVSRLRGLVDKELKKYNILAASHWLRHSRAYHIGEITGDPYAVQAVLGHADPRTSMVYVNQMRRSIYRAMEGGKTFEDYLGVEVIK